MFGKTRHAVVSGILLIVPESRSNGPLGSNALVGGVCLLSSKKFNFLQAGDRVFRQEKPLKAAFAETSSEALC
jgi:hypothetical protein